MNNKDLALPAEQDRAVAADAAAADAAEPEVSALRASIPSAGDTFTIVYPFVRDTYSSFDEEGGCEVETWKPGIKYVQVSEDHAAPVADAVGSATFTVVDTFKPGKFPRRVFFTRQFVNPDGHQFGKPKLHIVTLDKFRRLTRGYQHPFGIGEPLPSDHQWWRKGDAQREFEQMLADYAASSGKSS
jgi:hypothetical protein